MELYAFPLDSQDLNLMFEMRCAKGSSPFPVQLVLSKDLDATINKEGFMLCPTSGLYSPPSWSTPVR